MASGRIKGITIEIGGDTTQLTKALSSADKSLAKTQKDLNDVNRLLKFDPKNTDLLKQKQELLQKSLETTKERLDKLKEAQKQMDAAGVDKTSDEYKALQREIIATEQKLDKLKKQQKDFGSVAGQVLQQTGKELQKLGKEIKEVGDKMTKSITAPILAVGTASLAAFNEVDKGLDIVAKKTGATGDALKEYGDIVTDIATKVPTSYEKAGEAVGEVSTRFRIAGDDLEALSTKFIKFADINNTDVTAAVDNAQKALTAFGLSADDAEGYLDTLTRVSQNTGIGVDTLQNGLIRNAAAFHEMGLSIDEAADLMGQIEMSGADTNAVLGGLSKVLKNATKDGKSMDEALAALEESIKSGKNDTEALAQAYELFGKSGDQVFNAIKTGSLSFKELGKSAEDAGGAVEDTFAATKSPMEEFQTVLNQFLELGYELGNALMPMIKKAMDAIVPVIESLVSGWESLDETTQTFIMIAAGILAAVGPVVSVIGSLISVVGTITSVMGTMAGVISGPVVLAIGAAVAAGVLLWKNWDTVKEKAAALYQTIKDKFEAIKKKITETINSAKEAVKTAVEKIKGFFSGLKWEWPKIKLPHFKITGSMNPLKWATEGTPKITVDWYKKAANRPYYFNEPSVIGVGDVPEVVMGADYFRRMTGSPGSTSIINNIEIIQREGQSPKQLAREVITELKLTLDRQGRAFR